MAATPTNLVDAPKPAGVASVGGGGPAGKLEGKEVLQLTTFVQKQTWIEEKIQFLEGLPLVEVILPKPPERSTFSVARLVRFRKEVDEIEQEIDKYDMGDLTRLKTFAKTTLQNDLSPRDTDLLDVTLTTLFDIDKLMQLLRHRRASLSLLGLRLEWESQVEVAWEHYSRIEESIKEFISKVRWLQVDEKASVDQQNTPNTPIDQNVAHHHRLRHETNGTKSSNVSPMSRYLKSDTLRLALAREKSIIHHLTHSVIPTSANRLDVLIDMSSSPLPSEFLDEQDRLEQAVSILTSNLTIFLTEMFTLWKACDNFHARNESIRQNVDLLGKEIDSAKTKPSTMETATIFEAKAKHLKMELDLSQSAILQKSTPDCNIYFPTHSAIQDQEYVNADLKKQLLSDLRSTTATVELIYKRVKQYRFGLEAEQTAQELKIRLSEALEGLKRRNMDLKEEEAFQSTILLLDTTESLRANLLAHRQKTFPINEPDHAESFTISALLKESAASIHNLSTSSANPSLRSQIKELTFGVKNLFEDYRKRARTFQDTQETINAVAQASTVLQSCLTRCPQAIEATTAAILCHDWQKGPQHRNFKSAKETMNMLNDDASESLSALTSSLYPVLAKNHPKMMSLLETEVVCVHEQVRFAVEHLELAEKVVRRSEAVERWVVRARELEAEVSTSRTSLGKESCKPDADFSSITEQYNAFLQRSTSLSDSAADTIPMLGFKGCMDELQHKLVSDDDAIRHYVNSLSAVISATLDDIHNHMAKISQEQSEQQTLESVDKVDQHENCSDTAGNASDSSSQFSVAVPTPVYNKVDTDIFSADDMKTHFTSTAPPKPHLENNLQHSGLDTASRHSTDNDHTPNSEKSIARADSALSHLLNSIDSAALKFRTDEQRRSADMLTTFDDPLHDVRSALADVDNIILSTAKTSQFVRDVERLKQSFEEMLEMIENLVPSRKSASTLMDSGSMKKYLQGSSLPSPSPRSVSSPLPMVQRSPGKNAEKLSIQRDSNGHVGFSDIQDVHRPKTTSIRDKSQNACRARAASDSFQKSKVVAVSNSSSSDPSRAFTTPTKTQPKPVHRTNANGYSLYKNRTHTVLTPPNRRHWLNSTRKLDVEIGSVLNKLKVEVKVKAASETNLSDLSGMYWIGNVEPRLCFCRILQSKTVMVRVGGGWTHLEKFLMAHQGDASPSASLRISSTERSLREFDAPNVLITSQATTCVAHTSSTGEPDLFVEYPIARLGEPSISPSSSRFPRLREYEKIDQPIRQSATLQSRQGITRWRP